MRFFLQPDSSSRRTNSCNLYALSRLNLRIASSILLSGLNSAPPPREKSKPGARGARWLCPTKPTIQYHRRRRCGRRRPSNRKRTIRNTDFLFIIAPSEQALAASSTRFDWCGAVTAAASLTSLGRFPIIHRQVRAAAPWQCGAAMTQI